MSIKNYLLVWNKFPRLSLFCLTVPLLFLNSQQDSLIAYDEGYYANQARWIWETGDWLTPQWWGTPIYDRTIGLQWLIALAYHFFGLNEFSARLPSAIAGIVSVLLTYEIGLVLFDRQIAWLGSLMLMFMGIWISEVHLAHQSALLLAIELFGILGLLRITHTRNIDLASPKAIQWGWGAIAGMSVGLGFIVKGFMIFVPIVAILPYLILQQRYRQVIKNPGIYIGFMIGWIPTVAWLGLSYQKYGIMPIRDLINKVLFLSETNTFNPSPFYYFWNLPVNIFPWALFSAIGAWIVGKKLLIGINYSVISLTLGYPIGLFILLSMFKTRTPYYPTQFLPFMSLLAATAFIKFTQVSRQTLPRWHRFITWLSYAFSGLGIILVILGSIVITTPQIGEIIIPIEAKIYGIPAIVLGCGWATISTLWSRWEPPTTPYWLASWLVPVWFTMASFGLLGAWTDKNPATLAAINQPQIQLAIANQPVNLLTDIIEDPKSPQSVNPPKILDGEQFKTLIFITFYTPHLGKNTTSFGQLPKLAYAWTLNISPQLADRVQIIGKIDGWKLIQKL